MRVSVACNFDPSLIENLKAYHVYEVYGNLTHDHFGGGRPSFYLPTVDKQGLEKYVKKVHSQGIEFNYLINSVCMSNRELSKKGQRELRKLLDWLSVIGIDSITIANLLLLRTIKRCYPHFKVKVSAHRFTDNSRKAQFWEDNGADCIVVSETNVYREFEILKSIRESVKCDLQLIVNNSCRQDCAIAGPHATALNHQSQKEDISNTIPLDYHILFCLDLRTRRPVNMIRSNWIRPEDLHHYEALGYDNFKIVERNTPTRLLLERVEAYASRSYDGNLLDLIQCFAYPPDRYKNKISNDFFSFNRILKYFIKPFEVNIVKFMRIVSLGKTMGILYPGPEKPGVIINNKDLDGFIDRFLKQGCQNLDCRKCHYCHEWAKKVIHIDEEYKKTVITQFDELFKEIEGGSFWDGYIRTAKDFATKAVSAIKGFSFRH